LANITADKKNLISDGAETIFHALKLCRIHARPSPMLPQSQPPLLLLLL
jgi:hypothetical protein